MGNKKDDDNFIGEAIRQTAHVLTGGFLSADKPEKDVSVVIDGEKYSGKLKKD